MIIDALTNDKRVMMGFKTNKEKAHAVMVQKVKVWSSGRYKVYFAETSPVRIAPRYTNNFYTLGTARSLWTFYPNQ